MHVEQSVPRLCLNPGRSVRTTADLVVRSLRWLDLVARVVQLGLLYSPICTAIELDRYGWVTCDRRGAVVVTTPPAVGLSRRQADA
jgi:hypothetical protein